MRKYWLALAAFAVLLVLLLAAGFCVSAHTPRVVAVGTPIQHDDFFFTVEHIDRRQLRDGSAEYAVNVKVQNEAKVVDYRWRDGIAYVRAFDKGGFGHNFYPTTTGAFTLAPGESREVQLHFRVPSGFSSANIRFWDGIFMGDAFNGGAYARMIVPLEPYHPPLGT